MMKRLVCLLLTLLLIAGLFGCGAAASASSGSGSALGAPDASGGVDLPMEASAGQPLYPAGQLRFYKSWVMGAMWYSHCLNTRGGFYEIVSTPPTPEEEADGIPPEGSLMQVTDYATRQCHLLCSVPGCAHKDESCPAWLPRSFSYYILVEANGQLLLVDGGITNETYDETTGELLETSFEPPVLYTMDYQGQNRTELCRLEQKIDTWYGVATDDTYLYTAYRAETPAEDPAQGPDVAVTAVKIDLASGAVTELCELAKYEESIEGVLDGKLLLRSIDSSIYDPKYENDQAAWEENIQTNHVIYYTIDTETGERALLPGLLPNLGLGGTVQDGETLYYNAVTDYVLEYGGISSVGPSPQPVYKMSLLTGETTELVTFGEGEDISVRDIVDGRLLVTVTPQGGDGSTMRHVWIDLDTLEQGENQLFYEIVWPVETDNPTEAVAVYPTADAGDYFLVTNGMEVDEVTYNYTPQRALILKTDYWSGQENYIPIVDTAA